MCRVFGCVSHEPISIRHELLDAPNPLIGEAERQGCGWGMAVYERAEGNEPRLVRFPEVAHGDPALGDATQLAGRIFNVHVRRATLGGRTPANTHPFAMGNYSFGHSGTVIAYPLLLEDGGPQPAGETDSEAIFAYLMRYFDPGDVPGSLRRAMSGVVARSAFSSLNFLFSDGERLYAYRLGEFELHWRALDGALQVSSECLDDEPWHTVCQDVLLTLDPDDLEEPHAERLLGDELVSRAQIDPLEEQPDLIGSERGVFAAARAASVTASLTRS